MCGWTSGLALLNLAEGNDNLEFKKIDYCNSGDSPYGSKDEVVGYHAIALVEKNQKQKNKSKTSEEISLYQSGKGYALFDSKKQYPNDAV